MGIGSFGVGLRGGPVDQHLKCPSPRSETASTRSDVTGLVLVVGIDLGGRKLVVRLRQGWSATAGRGSGCRPARARRADGAARARDGYRRRICAGRRSDPVAYRLGAGGGHEGPCEELCCDGQPALCFGRGWPARLFRRREAIRHRRAPRPVAGNCGGLSSCPSVLWAPGGGLDDALVLGASDGLSGGLERGLFRGTCSGAQPRRVG